MKATNKSILTLTDQQVRWLKDLITADISDWQNMSTRPIDEVGARMHHLANVRIHEMQSVYEKLETVESIGKLKQLADNGLTPEIIFRSNDILAVVLCD